MTTYSKETALFDTGAIATDINEAGQTADRYITYVDADTGIQVHNAEDDDNYVQINSDGMEVFQDDASVAMFGTEARIGPLNDAEKVVIGNGGVSMYTSDNVAYFKAFVDDVNPKIIQIEYNLNPPITSENSGVTEFDIPSQSVGITEMISASDWNAVSNGNTFSIMISYGEFPPYIERYTGSFTKGTNGSFTKTYTRDLGWYGVRTVTCTVNYNSSNDTISFSGQATYTGPASFEWNAVISLNGIIYPKQVPSPKVQIKGDLIVTEGLTLDGTNTVADYVVEQGTSGIWTYRKWNSGIAECWGISSVASTNYAANTGFKNVAETLPLTFATPPTVTVSGSIDGWIYTDIGFTDSTTTEVQTYLRNDYTSAANNKTGKVHWYVIGNLP